MKKYNVILADPPWTFDTWTLNGEGGTPQDHYQTIPNDQMAEFLHPIIEAVADPDNCALFMWTVDWLAPAISQAVGEANGFTYRTKAFIWVKSNKTGFGFFKGRGYYTASNPEDCYLFVKGSMPVHDRSVNKLIYDSVREHSRKPDQIHNKIERLYPPDSHNYLELFARRKTWPNWDYWGNEIESDIDLTTIINERKK